MLKQSIKALKEDKQNLLDKIQSLQLEISGLKRYIDIIDSTLSNLQEDGVPNKVIEQETAKPESINIKLLDYKTDIAMAANIDYTTITTEDQCKEVIRNMTPNTFGSLCKVLASRLNLNIETVITYFSKI